MLELFIESEIEFKINLLLRAIKYYRVMIVFGSTNIMSFSAYDRSRGDNLAIDEHDNSEED